MKKQIDIIERCLHELEAEVESRNGTFANRAQSWQGSEKGEEYANQTEALQDLCVTIKTEIAYFREIFYI
jgi:hypothetical protein